MSARIARRVFHPVHLLLAIVPILAFIMWPLAEPTQASGPKTKIDTPIISCGTSTQASILIHVCAPSGTGATGLPAGFTIQWMTAAAYAANGNRWPTTNLCDASFSGNANLSRYNLLPGQCTDVDIGELLMDNGASTNCPNALLCGTAYVFRAFGHSTNTLNRSSFTGNLSCSTLACGSNGGCTLTQGFWKTHGPAGCNPSTGVDTWTPLFALAGGSLTLGNVAYTEDQICSIMNTAGGTGTSANGLIILAHQLVAAKLNILNGADPTDALVSIAAADAQIGNLVVPPVGAGYLAPSAVSSLVYALTAYNEGATGPGHCGSN